MKLSLCLPQWLSRVSKIYSDSTRASWWSLWSPGKFVSSLGRKSKKATLTTRKNGTLKLRVCVNTGDRRRWRKLNQLWQWPRLIKVNIFRLIKVQTTFTAAWTRLQRRWSRVNPGDLLSMSTTSHSSIKPRRRFPASNSCQQNILLVLKSNRAAHSSPSRLQKLREYPQEMVLDNHAQEFQTEINSRRDLPREVQFRESRVLRTRDSTRWHTQWTRKARSKKLNRWSSQLWSKTTTWMIKTIYLLETSPKFHLTKISRKFTVPTCQRKLKLWLRCRPEQQPKAFTRNPRRSTLQPKYLSLLTTITWCRLRRNERQVLSRIRGSITWRITRRS